MPTATNNLLFRKNLINETEIQQRNTLDNLIMSNG